MDKDQDVKRQNGELFMSVSYSREEICSGAAFTQLIDPKLKTNNVFVHFLEPTKEDIVSANAVIPKILSDSSEDYPSITALSRKLSSLYGASVRGGVSTFADCCVVSMACGAIADRYTISGEKINCELIDTFMGCLLRPNLENGVFEAHDFALKKQELLDDIDAEINDKRTYAVRRARELTYCGEPASININGTKEAAEKLTPADVYKRYKELLSEARIEVVYAGSEISDENKEKIFAAVRSIERGNIVQCGYKPSSAKKSVVRKTEEMDIVQSKMVMSFKSDCTNEKVLKLFSAVYGGTPFSKLFDNVREKLSLCYYCSSAVSETKQTMFIDSGVEHSNVEPAEKEILNQLELMKSGEFSDEDIEHARLLLINSLKSVNDSPRAMSEWYFRQCLEDEILSPEQEIERYKAVTREDIIAAAKSMVPDTVYVLTGKAVE